MNYFKFGLVSLLALMVFSTAFGRKNSSGFGDIDNSPRPEEKKENNVRDTPEKNPEKGKLLRQNITALEAIAAEAQKLNDSQTEKLCNDLKQSLEVLADFHESKEKKKEAKNESKKSLAEAYEDYKRLNKKMATIKTNIASTRRNTPEAKKKRKFQIVSRQYQRKAYDAANRGKKTEAEYYTVCAKIMDNAANNSQDENIEEGYKTQLNEAQNKYYEKTTLESAERFKQRAASSRKANDTERAEYYEKVVVLKKRLAKAYAEGDNEKTNAIWKEYEKLKKTK